MGRVVVMPPSAECTTLLRARKLFPLQFHFQVVLSTFGGKLKSQDSSCHLSEIVCLFSVFAVCLFVPFICWTFCCKDWWSCRDCWSSETFSSHQRSGPLELSQNGLMVTFLAKILSPQLIFIARWPTVGIILVVLTSKGSNFGLIMWFSLWYALAAIQRCVS